ncbi:MAG: hypothetical protein SFV17_25110 [Candidatus Obscuribacter sp.]|nr:hypothetical protein [Candidatus Melainabacteria bacterium]MDX1989997.1 hypothetical protein [Candidatus Obscuribacter sp.]
MSIFGGICLLLGSMYSPVIEPVLASNKGKSKVNCHEGGKKVSAGPSSSENASFNEEATLKQAFESIKENNLTLAVSLLSALARTYPENSDYSLLYSMALKRQDGEEWYRFQKWVARRPQAQAPVQPAFMTVRQAGNLGDQAYRLNELKKSTWLLLSRNSQGRLGGSNSNFQESSTSARGKLLRPQER